MQVRVSGHNTPKSIAEAREMRSEPIPPWIISAVCVARNLYVKQSQLRAGALGLRIVDCGVRIEGRMPAMTHMRGAQNEANSARRGRPRNKANFGKDRLSGNNRTLRAGQSHREQPLRNKANCHGKTRPRRPRHAAPGELCETKPIYWQRAAGERRQAEGNCTDDSAKQSQLERLELTLSPLW